VIDGPWRRICPWPDLGELNGPVPDRQDVVDHGFVRAADGTWHLWACIRGTAVGRLIYGWQGASLTDGPLEPTGVKLRAEAQYGESVRDGIETVGAPFFAEFDGTYYCFYHSTGLHVLTSTDGASYRRRLGEDGTSLLFRPAGRDAMVLRIDGQFFVYTTASMALGDGWSRGAVVLRTSPDLVEWSDYTVVSEGGRGGCGAVSAESPFVVPLDGYYYLFRSSSISFQTYVYRSMDPFCFGVHDDSRLIATLPIKAPEIVRDGEQWYISDLADWRGIQLAPLRWA
jgi:hypothetical protein